MANEPITVSVVIPVYNARDAIRACLDSVLAQTHAALEVLAVNDGSTDDSLEILRGYARRDARLTVFAIPNGGVAAARNYAVERATGAYIQFVDSDDELMPDATENLLAAMTGKGADLVIAPFIGVLGDKKRLRRLIADDQLLSQRAFLDKLSEHPNSFYYSVLWNKLYRRELIADDVRCDPAMTWGEDFSFNMRYFQRIQSVAILSAPVYVYHRNLGGLVGGFTRMCVTHPVRSIRLKGKQLWYYRELFRGLGLYKEYRFRLLRLCYRFTINN